MPLKAGGDEGQFPNYWHVGLCTTCVEVPVTWCLACVCAPCFSCHQRIRILEGDMDQYRCCGGAYIPCECGENKCPYFCLCLEVWFCFWCSVFGNRSMIQNEYRVQNTAFENCVIWFMCIFSWVYCIIRTFTSWNFGELEWLIDLIYCMFSACMQSQQEAELDYQRSGKSKKKGIEMDAF